MRHADCLRELLRPLGVYDLTAPFNGGELEAQGEALDGVMAWLEEIQRESVLTAAEDWGLENVAHLFTRRPVASHPRRLAEALAALLRIGGDSFTLSAINDTVSGCGIPAVVKELGRGRVAASFPGVAGEPESFEELKRTIEDILPAHLGIEYLLWYLTWTELEGCFHSFREIEEPGFTWRTLETCVEYL